jgi:thymidylate synthase
MKHIEHDYLNLLKDILNNGVEKNTRNGKTLSVFGRQIKHNMSKGFPLLTTKKMYFKGIITELLWFLRGDTNIKYLVDNNCNIWNGDAYYKYLNSLPPETDVFDVLTTTNFINKIKTDTNFAKKWGELGPIYGSGWRNWNGNSDDKLYEDYLKKVMKYTHEDGTPFTKEEFLQKLKTDKEFNDEFGNKGIDQIKNLIEQLKTNPDSRRIMVNAWNVADITQGNMVLPPCHYGFQVYTRELSLEERDDIYKKQWETGVSELSHDRFDALNTPTRAISLMYNQRSVDTPLGLPFNIASYALLLLMLAKQVNMAPDELIGNLGDTHIYLNQVDGIKEQLTRKPHHLPNVHISDVKVNDISDYTLDDISLINYKAHPKIKLPLSN